MGVLRENAGNYDSKTNSINVNAFSNNSGFKQEIVFAHELGHAWRDMNGLDISESPYEGTSPEATVFKMKSDMRSEFEAVHIENIVRSEMGYELRDGYGEMTDNVASNVSQFGFLDFKKGKPITVGKDSSYDYSSGNHYEGLKGRKNRANDINVFEYEDPTKFK